MHGMRDEHLTGIKMIDDDNSRLFEIAEEIRQLLHNELIQDKYDRLTEALDQLRDYARRHFDDEEEYLRKMGYKKIFTQMIEHNACLERLEEFVLEETDDQPEGAVEDLLEFFTEWMNDHILDVDVMIEASNNP